MSGILAAFDTEEQLRAALARLRKERVDGIETYTPMALEGELGGSPLPLVMFVCAMLGLVGFFALMTYADVWHYPLDIGGRPNFSWPVFIPIAFELSVLCAMIAGFIGVFVAGRLTRLHDPVDECDSFREAMRAGWFVAVRPADGADLSRARAVLAELGPAISEDIP